MDREKLRLSINSFLKLYFDSCHELYEEIGFGRLTRKQFTYLKMIYKNKDITSKKFAELSNLSKPTVSEILNRFKDMGLIVKRIDETDRRVSYIDLTEMGRILASTNELESKRITEKVIDKLDDEKLKTLVELFDELSE
jgi:DNA-binding MarR family transcriptional regulator